jgi:dipeptidyl aminopeptidase/acylaminoacyl peptidase
MLIIIKEYNILAPNYSGSAGYGEKFIEKLSGNIG